MTTLSYEHTLESLLNQHPELVVMTAENRATIRQLPSRLGQRFVDVGICEQTLVGMAAGLALAGRVPVVHALAAFLTMRGFEFIRTDVGIPNFPVKLVGFVPGVLSDGNGPTHQAIEDVALMRGIPNMRVFCPADLLDLTLGLPDVIEHPGPCYVRYCAAPAAVSHASWRAGQAEVLHSGDDVTLFSYGPLLAQAAEARKLLEQRGLSVGLVNMRWLAPLDESAILSTPARSLLVTIEDHLVVGGLYSAVTEVLVRRGCSRRVLPIGFENRWFRPARLDRVLEHEQLTGAHLASRVLRAL